MLFQKILNQLHYKLPLLSFEVFWETTFLHLQSGIQHHLHMATIYGNNFGDYGAECDDKSILDNIQIITGNIIKQKNYELYEDERAERITGLEGYNLTKKVEWKSLNNSEITVTGRVIGGCLDIISEIAGTKYDGTNEFNEKYKNDGIIWYFDNCELSKEELIRTIWKEIQILPFEHRQQTGRNEAKGI